MNVVSAAGTFEGPGVGIVLAVLTVIAVLLIVSVGIWLFLRRRAFKKMDGPTRTARGSSGAREYENSQGDRPFIDGSGGPDVPLGWP